MTDDKCLYWFCNRSKFMKISSSHNYVERLGCIFDVEWHLEIKSEFYASGIESPFCKDGSHELFANHPIWEFTLRRNDDSRATYVNANFFLKDTITQSFHLKLKQNMKLSTSFCRLNFRHTELVSSDITLIFVFETSIESMPTNKKRGLSKLKNLSEDLNTLLDKGNLFDVTLKCDTYAIRAHKAILAARSPVFEAMFNSDMQENEKDEVVIEDMEPDVFRAVVSFIYSGRIKDLNMKLASDLLYASEKYQIGAMKEGCVEYLQSILSHENSLEILILGDLYDESLKSSSMQYVCNNFNDFKTKEEWRLVKKTRPLLAMEIYTNLEPFIEKYT